MLRHPVFSSLTCDFRDTMPHQRSLTLLPRETEDFHRGGNHSKHMHKHITKIFICGENFNKKYFFLGPVLKKKFFPGSVLKIFFSKFSFKNIIFFQVQFLKIFFSRFSSKNFFFSGSFFKMLFSSRFSFKNIIFF